MRRLNQALEPSSWSQITFNIITNVLTSYFERFGPNFEQIYISPMVTVISVASVQSSRGQAGCNADFLSRF